jgi:hypothetical protein
VRQGNYDSWSGLQSPGSAPKKKKKANVRVKLAKTGRGTHSTTLVCICVVQMLFVLFYVVFVCKCVLPPNPIAVKYIYIYISYNSMDVLNGMRSLQHLTMRVPCCKCEESIPKDAMDDLDLLQ